MNRPYTPLFSFRNTHFLTLLLLCVCSALEAQPADSLTYVQYTFENGSVSSEGYLKDGKPEGYWKSYYRNGNLKTEGNRVAHQLADRWKFYDEKGALTLTIDYQKGIKNGFRKTFSQGICVKEESFKEGKKEGWTRRFDHKGRLIEDIPFVADREQGMGHVLDTNQMIIQLRTYKSGVLVRKQSVNRTDRLNRKQGTWMGFYPSRRVKWEGTYTNDLKNGYWKFYKKSGDLIRTEYWINGVLQQQKGLTEKVEIKKEIDPETGLMSRLGTYLNGEKNGVQKEFNADGTVSRSAIYSRDILLEQGGIIDEQGRKQGYWKLFYPDGRIRHEGGYLNGLRNGNWKYFYPDGKIEQQGDFVKDKPVGSWLWSYPNGSVWKEEEFINGLEDGMSVEYDSTGGVIAKGEYIEGMKEGPWFYQVGDHREEGSFFEGERTGKWVHTYSDTEQISFEGAYESGKETGVHIFYYPSGQIKRRGKMAFGKRVGLWEYFNKNGLRNLTIEFDAQGNEIRYNGVKVDHAKRK